MDDIDELFGEIFNSTNRLDKPFTYVQREITTYAIDKLKERYEKAKKEQKYREFVRIEKLEFNSSRVIPVQENAQIQGKAYKGRYSEHDNSLRIHYEADKKNKFKERLNLVEAIAFVVLHFVPLYCGEEYYVSKNEHLYFARKVLLRYSTMGNGSLLRGNDGLESETNIIERIGEIFPETAEPETKDKIDSIFNQIFSKTNENTRYFRCETRIIKEYIEGKNRDNKKVQIKYKEMCGWNTPRGNFKCLPDYSAIISMFLITHTSSENLEAFESKRKWKKDGMKTMNFLSIIIAHELGHLALHLMNFKGTKEQKEVRAFRWARLMLEMRELNYSEGNEDDPDYKGARNNWRKYIRTALEVMEYDAKYNVDCMMEQIYLE